MAPKPTTGKTNKYSGVVKSVKDNIVPEEPRITADQVRAAFESFGFKVNDRNHNDIAYWTTRGQSEGPKLIEELHKRRKDINDKEDNDTKESEEKEKNARKIEEDKKKKEDDYLGLQNESKRTLPRLSDEEISALFDEYGLPAPDHEWSRSHLPNDPKKIRSILEMQRKTADDMLKQQSKNAVNSLPQTPKPGTASAMPMRGAPMMGAGGPNPVAMQGGMVGEEPPKTPFFIGDHSIVRITDPNNPNASTTWLVDAKKKVLRPFLSEQAFQNAFESPEEAEKAVITITAKELAPGGALDGFKPLKADQGIQDDGSMTDIPFTSAELQDHYGQAEDPAAENRALSMLDGVFGRLGKKGQAPQGTMPSPDQLSAQPNVGITQ